MRYLPTKHLRRRAIRRVIDSVRRQMRDRYEVKEVVRERSEAGLLHLHITLGLPDDERTLASIYARYRLSVSITRRGKIMAHREFDKDRPALAKIRKYPLIYGWRS